MQLYVLRASDPLSPAVQRDGTELPSIGEEILTDRLRRLNERLTESSSPPVGLLIIDTVRASLSGSEDSSEHFSAYLRAVRRILATLPDAGALLAHHTGWHDGDQRRKRERARRLIALFLGWLVYRFGPIRARSALLSLVLGAGQPARRGPRYGPRARGARYPLPVICAASTIPRTTPRIRWRMRPRSNSAPIAN